METPLATPSLPALPPVLLKRKVSVSSRRDKKLPKKLPYDGKKMSLHSFLNWSPERSPFKYEWNNGIIETSEYMMKNTEWLIVDKLQRKFHATSAYPHGDALLSEVRCLFELTDKVRIPDLAYLTKEQLKEAYQGGNPIPAFVIEIISPTDRGYRIEAKMHEYFAVGIQVVWHIYPEQKEVRIFTSPKHIEVCSDEDFCTAKPVLMDFQLEANDLFGEKQ